MADGAEESRKGLSTEEVLSASFCLSEAESALSLIRGFDPLVDSASKLSLDSATDEVVVSSAVELVMAGEHRL